jgi:small subunit ribosomal protein S20
MTAYRTGPILVLDIRKFHAKILSLLFNSAIHSTSFKEYRVANHPSALKRHRQSLVRRERNKAGKSRLKTAVKSLLESIESKDAEAIQLKLRQATAIIDKTASKGIIKKTTASRKIARLAKRAQAATQSNG